MKIADAYNEWSQTYDTDQNKTRDLDHQALKRVLGKTRFKSIVEAGCGTGKNTRLLARLGKRVHAMDFSAGMLAQARKKLSRQPHVNFSVADLTHRWPCADHSADLVTCNLVLEHIADLNPVFSEASRVLVKGGWFAISELHPFRQYQGKVARFIRGDQTTRIPAFVHHISDFTEAATTCGFTLQSLQEWWHDEDEGKPPRLITFLFEKTAAAKPVLRRRAR